MVKRVASKREKVISKIVELKKDPEFMEQIRRFIDATTR